jgi:splicing factor 3B subunit 2
VDEYGRPLYGDVFGTAEEGANDDLGVDKTTRWGELVDVEGAAEEEKEEDGDDDGEDGGDEDAAGGTDTPATVDGGASLYSGMETPDTVMDLRKRAGLETPDTTVSRELYQVISERATAQGSAGQLFGSDRTYVLPGKGADDASAGASSSSSSSAAAAGGLVGESTEFEDPSGAGAGGDGKAKKRRRVEDNVVAKKIKDFKF